MHLRLIRAGFGQTQIIGNAAGQKRGGLRQISTLALQVFFVQRGKIFAVEHNPPFICTKTEQSLQQARFADAARATNADARAGFHSKRSGRQPLAPFCAHNAHAL